MDWINKGKQWLVNMIINYMNKYFRYVVSEDIQVTYT